MEHSQSVVSDFEQRTHAQRAISKRVDADYDLAKLSSVLHM